MAILSAANLVELLQQQQLLEATQLDEVLQTLLPDCADPRSLAKELLQRNWLTAYQLNQLFQGRAAELTLANYVVLERLGEGGMGVVFKARHRKLGQVVALKLIRKERLSGPDSARRFQREIQAAAKLEHPNVVRALDADEVNGAHFFAMEYVEGTDLAKLVKQHGALPLEEACDFIRQAALGLQHAHERGLVHRDIKPANLLLTKSGVVKVLDLGLARLRAVDEADTHSTTLTQKGLVMGTPDYISPEQARNSHNVDIWADLYSLGCTFYFLLTGKVPFPGGTLTEKLLKHQFDAPTPLAQVRPTVPSHVVAMVDKLMAKRPEERFQTPGDLAAALTATPTPATPVVEESQFDATTLIVRRPAAPPSPQRRGATIAVVVACVVVLALLLGGGVRLVVRLAFPNRPPQDERGTGKQPAKPVVAKDSPKPLGASAEEDAWLKPVAAMSADKQVKAVTARLKKLNNGFDGKVTYQIEGGTVPEFAFLTDNVSDISPVRALRGLKVLYCNGSEPGRGKLIDLTPLTDMQLTELVLSNTQVSDLTPLKDTKVTNLDCNNTLVADLTPLKNLKLTELYCGGTQVSDLTPLEDMKLTELVCAGTRVADLTPLKNMKLTYLNCDTTPVSDLTPLKYMNLTRLHCYNTQVSDLTPLKDMKPTVLVLHSTQVSDLTPLKNMKLTDLHCDHTKVTDLSPLAGMPLKHLGCPFKPERDAALLRSLTTLETINGKAAQDFWKEVDDKNLDKKP